MTQNIFIGGTGRSGTTLITRILGTHPKIYSLPIETRFIIDSDGIKDIVSNFSYSYNSHRADLTLDRFERLMLKYLTNPYEFHYRGYNFRKLFGKDFYVKTVINFCNGLRYSYFYSQDYFTVPSLNRKYKFIDKYFPNALKSLKNVFYYGTEKERINITKKFTEKQILQKSANFINRLFMKVAKDHKKFIWCEKTPQNILDIEFLYKLFPDTKFIHIKRDPREIVYSLLNQKWAPNNIINAALFLKGRLERLHEVLAEFTPNNNSYLEIKLEDLTYNLKETLMNVVEFLGLDYEFKKNLKINQKRVCYWKDKFSHKQINICEKILGNLILEHGY